MARTIVEANQPFEIGKLMDLYEFSEGENRSVPIRIVDRATEEEYVRSVRMDPTCPPDVLANAVVTGRKDRWWYVVENV
jgi:hypothetical protein